MTFRFRLLAGAAAVVLALSVAYRGYREGHVRTVNLAAGPSDGEPFLIARAIADVAERHSPSIRFVVLETSGSIDNQELLQAGRVDLALSQADVPPASSARLVATLYPDAFQLVARNEADVGDVADLRGKKIAIPARGSGQFDSFWFLAGHYGLSESDFEALPMSSESANWAMLSGAVDAVFRVRAPGNSSIRELIESSPSHLVSVDQAAAMRLTSPALDAGTIPKGSYQGDPALPPEDLATAVVQRLLVADAALDPEVVTALTRLLFERRRELVAQTPLAGFIAPPDQAVGTFMPVHEGAQRYYDRDQPSFFQQNAEPIALLLTVLALAGSGLLQLRSQLKRRRIDQYNNDVLKLYAAVRGSSNAAEIRGSQERLMTILGRVVDDAEENRITEEGFNLFSFTWEAVNARLGDLSAETSRRESTGG